MSATNSPAEFPGTPTEPATPQSPPPEPTPPPPYAAHQIDATAEGRQVTLNEWIDMLTLIYRTDNGDDLCPFHSPFKCFERDRDAARAKLNRLIPDTPGANQVTQERRDFIVQRFIRLHWTRFGAWNKSWDARHPKPTWQWKWTDIFTPSALFTTPWFIFTLSAAEEMYRGNLGAPILIPLFPAFRRAQERWIRRGWWEWGDEDPGWAFEGQNDYQPPVSIQELLDLEVRRVAREARRVARANRTAPTRRSGRRRRIAS